MRCTWMEMERCRLAKTQDDDKYDSKQPTLMDAGFAGRLRGRLSRGCSAVMQKWRRGPGVVIGLSPMQRGTRSKITHHDGRLRLRYHGVGTDATS